jgi:uncharacterized protein YkwD
LTVGRLCLFLIAFLLNLNSASAFDINAYRRSHGLPPLHASAALTRAAAAHAHDMARRNHLDHNGFEARMSSLSSTAAENVAFGCQTQDCVFKVWTNSSGHRRNMLMRGITRYGISSARAANGRRYWALELGN